MTDERPVYVGLIRREIPQEAWSEAEEEFGGSDGALGSVPENCTDEEPSGSLALLGIEEIAEAIDAATETVTQWYLEGELPEPDALLDCGPIWFEQSLRFWMAVKVAPPIPV
jgi:hypothetical protein